MKKGIVIWAIMSLVLSDCTNENKDSNQEIANYLKDDILEHATWALVQQPETVTDSWSERSAGTRNDFYSEGDYWWPDPENPDGPYKQRDGMTNPDNFVSHRLAMIRFSKIMGYLASAYKITGEKKYVDHALQHAKAWFIDPNTKMNPSLLYAQAIKGRTTGRGIGIIDTIHLMEVAQGLLIMENEITDKQLSSGIKDWFSSYLEWLMTHQYGKDEMEAKNNHGTCWVMQVASFAKFTGNEQIQNFCRERYKNILLPDQMDQDGSFPRETARTKPYNYSLFNLDAMVTICQILSNDNDNLWEYQTADGKSIGKGIEFLYPYTKNKFEWPYKKDVMYWEEWPIAHPWLIFGGLAFNNAEYLETWKSLEHFPENQEVIRNLPVRNPLIWLK